MALTAISQTAKETPSVENLISAARELAPQFRARAAETETACRISDETIGELLEAGLFDVVKPRRYGGYEMGWEVFSDVVIEIAAACGSTGWVYSVVGGHAPVVARFGTDFLDELWENTPNALVSSSRRIEGVVEKVDGGYRGSGIGGYSSGCLNAQWVIVESVPVAGEDRTVTIILPMEEVEILDTWHVVGLAGTGSRNVRFENAFIPEHRSWFPGKVPHGDALDGPTFRTPYLGGPLALPSVVLGIAIGGLEHFVAMTHLRETRQGDPLAEAVSMQMRIGESVVEINAALALLRAKLKETMAVLSDEPAGLGFEHPVLPAGGTSLGFERAVSGYIGNAAYSALSRLMRAAGAGQLSLSEPFQRCFRDVVAGIQQPSVSWDSGRIAGGQELLDRIGASSG